ncbi:MAG: zinc-binding dehydrogenase [Acidimicrobiaceae bacterium]|nr:zinc-binding dehydrogenase [Acidimicrobiaceae bacterium]MXW97836.1 zinc-binding dehydrogenase [Acidimicrobiaceae bacterium]MXZ96444.1 zinc-binding dehydrogenase [Acidimicrobiaceae bacterium]MYE08415.1 zinc-binding dehydrogenase [Acidimicrobiaceae bacterium]MYF41801.1 zinc-binding dehydrogenase [Acidimicrobiaceae bacterium]
MVERTNTVLTIPEPRTAALATKPYPVAGPGFVIVEVAVAPVCNEGRIYRDHQFEWHDGPEHLGHEGVGTVVEIAPGSRFSVGDRVIIYQGNSCQECFVCTQGLSPTHCLGIPYESYDEGMAPRDISAGLLGIEKVNSSASGGFGMARYRLAPEHMIQTIPDELSFHHAAAANCLLGCTYTAAEEAGVSEGDVVVVGAVGFIGLGAIVNSLYRGATVVVLGRHPFRMELCRRLGVHAIIDPGNSDWHRQLHAMTDGRQGADIAFECAGVSYYLDRCMAGLRRYGTLYSLGHGDPAVPYSLSILNDLVDRHIIWTGGHDVRFRDRAGLLEMLCDPRVQERIDAIVTHTFPMSRAAEAFEAVLAKDCGKVYLLPQE